MVSIPLWSRGLFCFLIVCQHSLGQIIPQHFLNLCQYSPMLPPPSSHTCNDSALALTFPLLNFVTIFSAALLCGQKKYVYSVPKKNFKQQKEKARKLFVCFALDYIGILFLKSMHIGTLTFICAGREWQVRCSAVAKSLNSEKLGTTISCFMGLITLSSESTDKTFETWKKFSEGVVDIQSRLRHKVSLNYRHRISCKKITHYCLLNSRMAELMTITS